MRWDLTALWTSDGGFRRRSTLGFMKFARISGGSLQVAAVATITAVCFLLSASVARGDFEAPPPPPPNLQATHAGVEILNHTVPMPVVNGSDLNAINNDWEITFLEPWDYPVPANNAIYALFRGSIDGLDGGEPVSGVNYSVVRHVIGNETASISFSLPPLGDPNTLSGIYTIAIAEVPDTKFTYNPITDTFEEETYEDIDFAKWFTTFEGTYAPIAYRFLEFEYVAGEAVPDVEECCSSVAFLPGFKGSVLKIGSDTIWPPTLWSNDVPQLALNDSGVSVNDVRVDGVMNNFFTTTVYAPFVDFLDGVVSEGTIDAWIPLPYDWRLSPTTIVEEGVNTPQGIVDMVEEIEQLASESQTGHVTLVAHSMGGLVGKALIKKLEEEGKADLIDSFVMVGTPQLGTPQAAGSLLHGDDEWIPLFVNPATSRTLGQNMPAAYTLLPSPRYFEEVDDPVITFDPAAAFTEPWRNYWGEDGISAYLDFFAFLTGGGVTRTDPSEDTLRIPEILDVNLTEDAMNFHTEFDSYEFPDNIRVVQVAGWGRPTVKAIEYRNSHFLPSYKVKFTDEGDKTVVYPSAVSSDSYEVYYFDLFEFNKNLNQNSQHRDLLNTSSIQKILKEIISEAAIENIEYIHNEKPVVTNLDHKLIVSTHSPVILGAYDSFGNFTGIDQIQDLSAEFLAIKEEIPGSTFLYSAEGQYIFLPKSGSYNFVYKGLGSGPTTVEIDNFVAEVTTPLATYSDIPTTLDTVAAFAVNTESPGQAVIRVDSNDDGQVDEVVLPDGAEVSLTELLAILKQKIATMNIKESLKKNLLKKVAALEKRIEKKKDKKATKNVSNLTKKIFNKAEKGKISDSDAQELLNLLEQIENAI